MGRRQFVERHGDGWRFRVRIPARVVRNSSRRELRVTLGPLTKTRALIEGRRLRVEAERLFEAVALMTDVMKAEAAIEAWRRRQLAHYATKLHEEGSLFLTATERAAASDAEADHGFGIDLLMRSAHEFADNDRLRQVRRALAGDPDARRELRPVADAGLRAAQISEGAPPAVLALLTTKVLQAHLRLQQDLVGLGHGDPEAIAAALDALTPANLQIQMANRVVGPARDEAPPSVDTLPFQEWWDRFVEDMVVTTRQWKQSRRPELIATSRLWQWIVGKDPHRITADDIVTLRDTYLHLPRNYHRDKGYATRTPQQIIEAAKDIDPKYLRVEAKTFNKHHSTLKSFFEWLKARRKLPANFDSPFDGLAVKIRRRGRSGRGERAAYRLDQIETIFKGPIWLGRQSRRSTTKPGSWVIRDALYWVPLLCAYQSMRREEACQLLVKHVSDPVS